MTTCAEIEAAWQAGIFEHSDILDITDKCHAFEVTQESEAENQALYYGQRINFFEYLVTRASEFKLIGAAASDTFTVDVRYTLEKDTTGEAYAACRDAMLTVIDLLPSELTADWSGTVDYYQLPAGPPQVVAAVVDGRLVWRTTYTFTAFIL